VGYLAGGKHDVLSFQRAFTGRLNQTYYIWFNDNDSINDGDLMLINGGLFPAAQRYSVAGCDGLFFISVHLWVGVFTCSSTS